MINSNFKFVFNFTYLIDFLFESLLEHLICLIENNTLDCREINIAPFNMIKNSTTGSHKEVHTSSKLSCLVIDVDTSIYCKTIKLIWMMLQFLEFILNLLQAKMKLITNFMNLTNLNLCRVINNYA